MTLESLEPALAAIEASASSMRDRLTMWANINSGSMNPTGLNRMAAVLVDAFRDLHASSEQVALPGAVAPALRVRVRPDAPRQVLLSGHYDTVYGPNHPFQACSTDGDVLRGPGVADMKGGLVVMLGALQAFESCAAREQLGWEVIITPDEETGSTASAPLLREIARRHHLAVVFEPALPDGSIVGSRNGVGTVRATATGRSAHAGRDFAQGRNAIVALSRLLVAAHELNGALPGTIVNVGVVSGGGTVNIVPDHASADINLRTARGSDGDALLDRLRAAAATISDKTGVAIALTGGFTRPPMEASARSESLLRAWSAVAAAQGVSLTWAHSGGGSDGNLLAAAGLPCIDGAGVEGGDLHSDREWMRLSSLARRAKIAAGFLALLASGAISHT